ncbi:MAG: HD domain-containing protein [Nitrospirae bacterium]|nr:HD domain-containing protein [Nitrospirota bacterium]
MTVDDLKSLKKWFSDYTSSFHSSAEEDNQNYNLKIEHTRNVCENIVHIAQAESLSADKTIIAEAIALFHDIGRFPQYAKFKTFNDRISINHGMLGADVLVEEGVLKNLSERDAGMVITGVKFHNAFSIPKLQDEMILYLRLIRDADKLDILRVFIEYYEDAGGERSAVPAHGLPDNDEYSKEILSSICKGKIASFNDAKTLNDFKLMHLSWVFDLNFYSSLKLFSEREYIKKVAKHLPKTDEILEAVESVQRHLDQRLEQDRA